MNSRDAEIDVVTAVAATLEARGLVLRGGFHVGEGEGLIGRSGKPARSLLLIGNAGGAMWPQFRRWLEEQSTPPDNPLDRWTRAVVAPIAEEFAARPVFPFERPYWPFQQWAERAEDLRPSPLGILMHREYGLWHAYRAALLFEAEIRFQQSEKSIHLCDECREKPCLSACPVDAFDGSGFVVGRCRSYLFGQAGSEIESKAARRPAPGRPDCMSEGCAARNACPYGRQWRYGPEQMRFHMTAFAGG